MGFSLSALYDHTCMPLSGGWLPVYNAKQLRLQGKQYYVDEVGRRLPSVTTILNATRPPERREALANWRQRVGVEAATQITTTASRRGTGTHKQIQRYLQGENPTCPEAVRPYWDSVQPVLQELDEVRLVEGTVFHYDLGYAGKVDCVASYRGTPCICEWKTADRPRQELKNLYDHPLQVVAYCGAANWLYEDYQLDLHHALLVVALPDQPAEIFWIGPEMIESYWDEWEQRLAAFQRLWRNF